MRHALWLSTLVACSGSDGSSYFEAGECSPPTDGTALTAASTALTDGGCEPGVASDVTIVETQASWDALFPCGAPPPPPPVDFATERVAVVSMACSPLAHRFTSERADEIVIGVYTWPSGACLTDVLVVPLARGAKPVRLAHCYEQCEGDCPPVP